MCHIQNGGPIVPWQSSGALWHSWNPRWGRGFGDGALFLILGHKAAERRSPWLTRAEEKRLSNQNNNRHPAVVSTAAGEGTLCPAIPIRSVLEMRQSNCWMSCVGASAHCTLSLITPITSVGARRTSAAIFTQLNPLKRPPRRPTFLSRAELWSFHECFAVVLWLDVRTKSWFVCSRRSGASSSEALALREAIICDLIPEKNPPVLPCLSSSSWAGSAGCTFLPSEQLPVCLQAAAEQSAATHSWRESLAEVMDPANGLWASEADSRWRCKFVWDANGGGRWMKKLKRWKIIACFTLHFPVTGQGRSITHWAGGRGTPLATSPACQRATHKHTFSWAARPAGRSNLFALCWISDVRNSPDF